jgi:hypothetical protein
MKLDAPREAADAEALRAAALRAFQQLRGRRRRFDAVLVPVQRVGAVSDRAEHRVLAVEHADRRPGDEPPGQAGDLAAVRVGQQLRAEADAEERDLPLDRRADQLGLRAQCGVPRRLLAAEGDDAVDRVEVRERAEVLLDRAERLGRVAEERLLEVVDDRDHVQRSSMREAIPASVARP